MCWTLLSAKTFNLVRTTFHWTTVIETITSYSAKNESRQKMNNKLIIFTFARFLKTVCPGFGAIQSTFLSRVFQNGKAVKTSKRKFLVLRQAKSTRVNRIVSKSQIIDPNNKCAVYSGKSFTCCHPYTHFREMPQLFIFNRRLSTNCTLHIGCWYIQSMCTWMGVHSSTPCN